MKSWRKVVLDGIAAFRSKEYVYFYGAKNIVLTEANMNYLIAAEPQSPEVPEDFDEPGEN